MTTSRSEKVRTARQNAYLWGVVYQTILKHKPPTYTADDDGRTLEEKGWIDDDLHELFLGEHFGWVVLEGFGSKRKKPKRRSSKLPPNEFSDYMLSIQAHVAPMGIVIPDPEGEL
jgi:hypothetical protein